MASLDVAVSQYIEADPARVRAVMFEPRREPRWMAAVRTVEEDERGVAPGARVRRTGRFLGRTLRWTTEIREIGPLSLDLAIIDGPMRGSVAYRIEPSGRGALVTIRNIGDAPGFAPRPLLRWAMRRALAADLRRLAHVVTAEAAG